VISSLIGLICVVAFYDRFMIKNVSISEPLGYYLKLPVGTIEPNKRYLICLEDKKYIDVLQKLGLLKSKNQCPTGTVYLMKQVAGMPHDLVQITESGVLINGVLQQNSKGVAKAKGISLYPLPIGYKHILKSNEYFMMGITPTSIDSRYFGVINRNQFYYRAFLFLNNE
jgi:conjugative transfer signal peptidase TraF